MTYPCSSLRMSLRWYLRNNSVACQLRAIVAFLFRQPGLCVVSFCAILFIGYGVVSLFARKIDINEDQAVVNHIANNVIVHIEVLDHTSGDSRGGINVKLTNKGYKDIYQGHWRIYFNCFGLFSTQTSSGFEIVWINGGMFYIAPIEGGFTGIPAGDSVTLTLEGWSPIARTDFLPRWYVWSATGNTLPAIIESTKDESLSFIGAFNESYQWKSGENDQHNPYTPGERFSMNQVPKGSSVLEQLSVIPTPKTIEILHSGTMLIDHTWLVIQHFDTDNDSRSSVLATKLGLQEVQKAPPGGNYFEFFSDSQMDEEEYSIKFDSTAKRVTIFSKGNKGAFYATQTLCMILRNSKMSKPEVYPDLLIKDKPRFSYRGLMLDVARNFHSKETVLKLLDVMSMYKMNKLHLHLSDDEGWRLEIPGFPELTKYGSRRCYDLEQCLPPSLGSGPYSNTSGSGYYSVSEFREILRYAAKRHIEVIPEIDMPGHALAAVFAMTQRERNVNNADSFNAKTSSFLLADSESAVPTVQAWKNNAINPCLNTTYMFIDKLISGLKIIYYGAQRFKLLHLGGDEVANGVWKSSPSCLRMLHGKIPDHKGLMKMFVLTVGDIADKHDLKIALWEDGAFGDREPFDINDFKQEVYVNTWNNIWEQNRGGMPITFSSAGYKVIISMATHLYFDHPYEPDPEERGLHWATRFIDTYKTFGLIPLDIFANADFDRNGEPVPMEMICPGGRCPRIKKLDNIVGLEACVWSETIRTEGQLHSMIFPRVLAFAERAWHEARWETFHDIGRRDKDKSVDWGRFVRVVGQYHLPVLERMGIKYRVPPPGMYINTTRGTIEFNSIYPNHKIFVSLGNGVWHHVTSDIPIPKKGSLLLAKTLSPVLDRESRVVSMTINVSNGNVRCLHLDIYVYFLICFLVLIYFR
ncbi:hypothetical protein ACF0H5_018255 [Mactra antiquata]